MSPSDNSFTDNLFAVDRIYATHSGVATPDDDGNVDVPHIDSDNVIVEDTPEPDPVPDPDPDPAPPQPGADEDGFGGDAPEPEGGHPEVTDETDPDELSEAELEAATAPEGEEQR